MLIETKVLGSRKRPYEPWETTLLEYSTEIITLQDFLKRVVLQEVEAFKNRQEERKLARVLSKEEIEASSIKGKIDAGGMEYEPQEVDPVAAVENALLAFKDGFYYVFVDEKQALSLEENITLNDNSHVLFLRLVPLVGG
ncbi:MAG: hypothetical protein ACRCYY_11115 [Trueperaceae bacterium]